MSNLSLYEQDRLSKLPFYPMFKQFDMNVDQSRNTSMKREEPITMELELIRNETIGTICINITHCRHYFIIFWNGDFLLIHTLS